jgi:septal ring factor EnvC (AmiA/AmiB activator)
MAHALRPWRRRLLGVAVAATALASLGLAHQAGAASSAAPADVASQLRQVKGTLADARADAKKLAAALDGANHALDQAENELATAQSERLAAHARGVQAQAALDDARVRVDQLRQVLGDRARGLYMAGAPGGIPALVDTGSDANQLLSQVAMLDQLARQSNDSLDDLVVAEHDYAIATVALRQAEQDAARAETVIQAKVQQATQLRDARAKAKEALDARIRQLEGQAGVLRLTQQQRAADQAGFQRGGGACDLSGTSAAEYNIIMRESHGDPTARNPRSTAFGLGQLLLDLRQRLLGADANTTDCGRQLYAFRAYVRERYGTAENAWAFWQAHGWY